MKPAIQVDGLSKRYRLGASTGAQYQTLRESIASSLRFRKAASSPQREFWALKDVSFEIQPGEVVGLIGRNGAGKSTALKVLSRITEPTHGRAVIRGRVGSLLEVGTGFHNELTGRENVYLNGSILGMTRREIDRKFDEIVAFAEVEQFLDTPVKRYSSGMYVRLAFAVAAHLEPEVLIVDEVLAVGDATYQRKCINRMRELAQSGHTILFVSHNLDIVPRLCKTALHLEKGRLRDSGPAADVVEKYLRSLEAESSDGDLSTAFRVGDGRARFTRVELHTADGAGGAFHRSGDDLLLRLEVDSARAIDDVALAVNLRTAAGTRIHSAWSKEQEFPVNLRQGKQGFNVRFQKVAFRPGMAFEVELWMADAETIDHVPQALRVVVRDGVDTQKYSNNPDQGFVLTPVAWTAE